MLLGVQSNTEKSAKNENQNRLERLLNEQQNLLQIQSDKLVRTENLLRSQIAKMSRQQRLLQRQNLKLSEQETLLSKQEKSLQRLKSIVKMLQRGKPGNSPVDTMQPAADAMPQKEPVTGDSNKSGVLPDGSLNLNLSSLVTRDLVARSDDTGPLDTVVSQISQRVTEISADVQTLKNANSQQDRDIQDAKTSSYIHWGSSRCSGNSQLIYSGVVGGSRYDQAGAAVNYLCLTMSPVLLDHAEPFGKAVVYGTEYHTYDIHDNMDAVCSVCRSSYSSTIMIPGTNVCISGWHLQYSGFLMAGHYDHTAGSEFICVDSTLESRPGSSGGDYGKRLFYTFTRCGSLSCGPYVHDKLMSCVVCSI